MDEIWKDVVGFKGIYKVSSLGRLKSLERIVVRKNDVRLRINEKIILGSDHHGYLYTTLRKKDCRVQKFIHVIVAEAFIGVKPEGKEVCHFDGNRKNNCVNNLRYGTRSDNVRDAIAHATHYTPFRKKGSERSQAKINEEIAKLIKNSADSSYVLAKRFNVSRSLISNIKRNRAWTHVN
jgi:hypothetical protein